MKLLTLLRDLIRVRFPMMHPDSIDYLLRAISEGENVHQPLRNVLDHPDLADFEAISVGTALIVLGGQVFGRAANKEPHALDLMQAMAEALAGFGVRFEAADGNLEKLAAEIQKETPDLEKRAQDLIDGKKDWNIH